ncbi:hypothetical protein L873DRAFT_1819223, partial [Choiromyces venosus 120613-1]
NNNNHTNNYSLHHIYKSLPLLLSLLFVKITVYNISVIHEYSSPFAIFASLCETFKTDQYSYFQQ